MGLVAPRARSGRVEALLAIESSCDETAVALVCADGRVLGQKLFSQVETHRRYGGVVPEVASRSHFDEIDLLCRALLEEVGDVKITRVAATRGPGLIGPLLVGASYAEGLAMGWDVPFEGVHHLRGHLASVLLGDESARPLVEKARDAYPSLVVLVSGGHTQVLKVDAELRAQSLADTADDAAGECFDKSAKLMGLPYPGGPQIEALALKLEPERQDFARELAARLPRPRSEQGFSFSGLKTAVRLQLEKDPSLKTDPAFAWAVQEAIAETLIQGMDRAWKAQGRGLKRLAFCGGVAANQHLRGLLETWARKRSLELRLPPMRYCTDNAAMIGAAAWVQAPDLKLAACEARCPL
jgi:N6-L-threonylcarbamoyladenine synthase